MRDSAHGGETTTQAYVNEHGSDDALLASGLRQLQSMGVATGGSSGQHPGQLGIPGGGSQPTRFQQVEQIPQPVQLVPSIDGEAAIENLRRLSTARDQRVTNLRQVLQADQHATASVNPVDSQKLELEVQLAADLRRMIEKLSPFASSIDADEASRIVQLVSDSNVQGRLDPAGLARVLIQVEGRARNLPASYRAAASRGQDFAASIDARLDLLSNQLADVFNQGGVFDPTTLEHVTQLAHGRARLSDALRRNFDLATTDPTEAQAQLDRALESTDLATVIASLA